MLRDANHRRVALRCVLWYKPWPEPSECGGVYGRNRECQFADRVYPPFRDGEQLHILLSFDQNRATYIAKKSRRLRWRRPASQAQKAVWLHLCCMRALPRLGVELLLRGVAPTRGLIVSNHLSYLDILAFSAALPCVFVSKAEVTGWPIIGRFAEQAGTIFVRREKQGDGSRANASIAERLRNDVCVVLFPEATTTNGEQILRFHSTMLQPAIDAGEAITPSVNSLRTEGRRCRTRGLLVGEHALRSSPAELIGQARCQSHYHFRRAGTGDRRSEGTRIGTACTRRKPIRAYAQPALMTLWSQHLH